jgi:hypothetical protein
MTATESPPELGQAPEGSRLLSETISPPCLPVAACSLPSPLLRLIDSCLHARSCLATAVSFNHLVGWRLASP